MSATTRDEIIAEEQKAVDRAYDCYAERLAELTGGTVAAASASGKDGVSNKLAAAERAAEYDGLGGESLVFRRVDTKDGAGGEPDTWYVGRRAVSDVHTRDIVVVHWASDLAKKWYEARPEVPGDVLLRRRLDCAGRVVHDYADEIAAPGQPTSVGDTAPVADAPGEATSAQGHGETRRAPLTPADVASLHRKKLRQPDDFLLRELQRSRTGSMRDIVETIRRDQMALVTDSPSDILVVQGGPGTGKSAVGLHRVTWLVNNEHFKAQDILVVGPHQRFLEYVSQVLPTLGTRNVNAVQVDRLWDGEILGADSPRARAVKSDERMASVLRRRVESECRPEAVGEFTSTASYEGAEPELSVSVGSTTLRVPQAEVVGLLENVRGGDGSYRERRDRFRSLLVDRLLRELAAVAPRRSSDDTIRRALERNRQVERLIERVWPSPGARESLRSLYASPDLLRDCAEGILDENEQVALHRPRAEKAETEPWTLDDLVCLEELRHLITGETPRRYGHIVCDEAQDLTPMQARALRRRSAVNGSMTVLGDLAQATGPQEYTDWDRLGALLSDQGDWHVAELTTSYRVPAEIMEFVAPLARAVAPTLPYPQAVREAGAGAVRTVATEPWKLLDETVAQVSRLVGTSDGRTLRSVAVIVPDDSGWLDEIDLRLNRADGITERERAAVSVLAAAQAKGMEYDHVLVVEPATIADRGPAGLRQLYVALTRSTQSLTVLHASPLPRALTDIDGDSGHPSTAASAPTAGDVPDIGTDIRVRVTGTAPGGRYKVRALSPVVRVPLFLIVRHGSAAPRPGMELDCWVFAHEGNHLVLTVDQRGRQPISQRMAERYTQALGVLDELISGGGMVPEDARDRLSELKGMANRVLRRDQADWVDVRHVLGSPNRDRLALLRDLADGTNRALKDGSLDLARLEGELARTGWAQALADARRTLRHRAAAVAEPEPESASAPAEPISEQKEAESVTSAEARTETAAGPARELLHALESAASADRTCNKHEAVRLALQSALLWADLQPTWSPIIDVSCVVGDARFLYEVLGAGQSAYADLRSGAVRLLEINHTLPTPADRLYLVLPEPPAEEWSAGTLHGAFGVHLMWRTPDGWGGGDTESALGSMHT